MKATIDFDEQLNRRLKIEAVRRGLTIRNVVSDAVRQVLDGPPTGSGGPTDAEWTPVWIGSLAQYAHNASDHAMESVRKSIARGRRSKKKP